MEISPDPRKNKIKEKAKNIKKSQKKSKKVKKSKMSARCPCPTDCAPPQT